MATSRICSIPGCDKPVHGHGYCIAHYERWRRYGAPWQAEPPMANRSALSSKSHSPIQGMIA